MHENVFLSANQKDKHCQVFKHIVIQNAYIDYNVMACGHDNLIRRVSRVCKPLHFY